MPRAGASRRSVDHLASSATSAATRRSGRRAAERRRLLRRVRGAARGAAATRSPSSRTRRARGTWPSTGCRSARRSDPRRTGGGVRLELSLPALLQQARRRGIGIDLVPRTAGGRSTSTALERMIAAADQAIALTHVPTQRRPGQPGERVGRVRAGARAALPARRLPVRRADAARCRADRVRRAVGDRAEVPARAAGHGLPLRLARGDRSGSSRPSSTCARRLDGARRLRAGAGTARRFENWESYVAGRIGLPRRSPMRAGGARRRSRRG